MVCSGANLRGDPEFAGISDGPQGTKFLLSDPATRESSGWVTVGDSFERLTLRSYDRSSGLLTLPRDGETLVVSVRRGSISSYSERKPLSGTIEIDYGGRKLPQKYPFHPNQTTTFPLGDGVSCEITPSNETANGTTWYQILVVRL
jgi:hypothetical protein